MYRRISIILLLVVNIFMLTGCWDRNELENMRIISAFGIEAGSEGKIRIIVQPMNTEALIKGAGGKGVEFEKAYRNTVIEGDTVYDALNNLMTFAAAKRSLSHTDLLIISEDLARDRGVQDVLDFFDRDPGIRLDAWFTIASGSVVDLMDIPGRISTTPGSRISEILKFHDDSFTYAPLKLGDFIRLIEDESSQAYTVLIEAEPNASVPSNQGHGILDGNVPEPLENIVLHKTAVFRQDKMVGYLNSDESRGLLWLKGEVKGGTIAFSLPEWEGKKAVTTILRTKTELEPEIINGQVYITAKIEVKSVLNDNQPGIKISEPGGVKVLEAAQSEEVKREVEAALRKAQEEYKVDVFGFGEVVHHRLPREWQDIKGDWSDIFPDVQVNIQVKSLIEHTLTTGNAPKPGRK